MAHVKHITSRQITESLQEKYEGNTLHCRVDNAGQTVWYAPNYLPHFVPAMDEKLARMMNASDKGATLKLGEVREAMELYHKRVFSGAATGSYPKEQMQGYLSLLYHLQPESEAINKQAISKALEKLELGAPLSEEELGKKFPVLIASVTAQFVRSRG